MTKIEFLVAKKTLKKHNLTSSVTCDRNSLRQQRALKYFKLISLLPGKILQYWARLFRRRNTPENNQTYQLLFLCNLEDYRHSSPALGNGNVNMGPSIIATGVPTNRIW